MNNPLFWMRFGLLPSPWEWAMSPFICCISLLSWDRPRYRQINMAQSDSASFLEIQMPSIKPTSSIAREPVTCFVFQAFCCSYPIVAPKIGLESEKTVLLTRLTGITCASFHLPNYALRLPAPPCTSLRLPASPCASQRLPAPPCASLRISAPP